jgi:hypothetical protein
MILGRRAAIGRRVGRGRTEAVGRGGAGVGEWPKG